MVQALPDRPEPLTFEAFLEWYPEGRGRYELIDGLIRAMRPTGDHEEVGAFIAQQLNLTILQQNWPYFIPRDYIVKPPDRVSGYQPDVLVVDKSVLGDEPLWKKSSVLTRGASIKLAIEVVSTNWRDDYGQKLFDYEAMGIPEYWIVDFRALGARRFTGSPKQPTFTLCSLLEGEYQLQVFRNEEAIASPNFPNMAITAREILQGGSRLQ
jgi:Uma2 family endonuclease